MILTFLDEGLGAIGALFKGSGGISRLGREVRIVLKTMTFFFNYLISKCVVPVIMFASCYAYFWRKCVFLPDFFFLFISVLLF